MIRRDNTRAKYLPMSEVTAVQLKSVDEVTNEQALTTVCTEHYQVIFMMFELDIPKKSIADIQKTLPFMSREQIHYIIFHSQVYKDMLENGWRPSIMCDEPMLMTRVDLANRGMGWMPSMSAYLTTQIESNIASNYAKALLKAEKLKEEFQNV